MKKIVTVFIITFLLSGFFANAEISVETVPGSEKITEILDAVPEDTKELMEDFGIDEITPEKLLSLSFGDFLKFIWKSVSDFVVSPIKNAFLIVAITIMCALLGVLKSSFNNETLNHVFGVVATAMIVAIVSTNAVKCINNTCDTVSTYNDFMISYVPIYGAACAGAGNPATSSVYAAGMFLACEVISNVIASAIIPLTNIYLAICIVSGLNTNFGLDNLTQSIKKCAVWIFSLLMTLFVGIMSVQSVIAVGKDSLAIKTGRYIIGSFVPIVGSSLSEVFLSVQGCMKLLKNSIGIYAVIATAITFIPTLINLLMWKFSLFISQLFAQILDVKNVGTLCKSISQVFSILMAVVLVFSMLIIISTTLIIIVTTGVG